MIELLVILTIALCLLVLFTAILINFLEAKPKGKVKHQKRSLVATGTMTLFFFFFYYLIRFQIGAISLDNFSFRIVLVAAGLAMIVGGCVINIKGRFDLGKNWANQIKIYQDQSLVTRGVYQFIRHPLYASLILMFYGASIVYLNYVSFLANTFIFLPFMYYRARQEESLLISQFKDYPVYQLKTGMFFPKLSRRCKNV